MGTALSRVCHPRCPQPMSLSPTPTEQPVLQHQGLVNRPRVFLVSILEGFAVKIALVGAVKLQKLVCYEAAGGTQPPPRACWPEVAGAGGQGHMGAPLWVTVSPQSLNLALEQPQEEQAQENPLQTRMCREPSAEAPSPSVGRVVGTAAGREAPAASPSSLPAASPSLSGLQP